MLEGKKDKFMSHDITKCCEIRVPPRPHRSMRVYYPQHDVMVI